MAEHRGDWLRRSPVAIKLLFYFGVLAALTAAFRLFGAFLRNSPTLPTLFSWADVRYFAGMWAIFTGVHYLSRLAWTAVKQFRKQDDD